MINRITVLCITALFAHSLGANLNHEDVKTFDMFPQHYQDGGQHDPEFDHTAFLGGIVSIQYINY